MRPKKGKCERSSWIPSDLVSLEIPERILDCMRFGVFQSVTGELRHLPIVSNVEGSRRFVPREDFSDLTSDPLRHRIAGNSHPVEPFKRGSEEMRGEDVWRGSICQAVELGRIVR